MRLFEIYDAVIAHWPAEVRISDGNAAVDRGYCFPSLSAEYKRVEALVEALNPWASLMNWAMFQVFLRESTRQMPTTTEKTIRPAEISNDAIEAQFTHDLVKPENSDLFIEFIEHLQDTPPRSPTGLFAPIVGNAADRLAKLIEKMSPEEARSRVSWLREHLRSRWVLVRMKAVSAYFDAGLPLEDVLEALKTEPSEDVVEIICGLIFRRKDVEAVPVLEALAANHRLPPARNWAITTIWDLVGAAAIPYFRSLRAGERNRCNRATLNAILVDHGDPTVLPELLRAFASRDSMVQRHAAVGIALFKPRKHRRELLAAIRSQLGKEPGGPASDALQLAHGYLSSRRQGNPK